MENRYEHFSSLIASIHRGIQRIEREEMVQYGCRGAFAQYLAALSANPQGLTSAQLTEIIARDKAAVSRVVQEMAEKGLICRLSDTQSLYRAKLVLTPEGQKAADFVTQRARTAVMAAGSEITESERLIFYRCLESVARNLDSLAQNGLGKE